MIGTPMRILISALLLAMLPACMSPNADSLDASPAALNGGCATCQDWLDAPSVIRHGDLCEGSEWVARHLIACGFTLGDCSDLTRDRPLSPECITALSDPNGPCIGWFATCQAP
jgi:hypothetical protein